MHLKPVEQTTVFRIPGSYRQTTVSVQPYLDAKRGALVLAHTKSVAWMIEPFGCLLILGAIVAFFTV